MNVQEYPCGVCEEDVENGGKAIQCDSCLLWFHTECTSLTEQEYDNLSSSDSIWECLLCKHPDLPDFNTVDAVDVFHFDFQQNLPTPKLTVGQQFYLRLLWTYLFGIFSASTQMTTAFMWHELLAKRGCNDVISCIAHFIFHTPLGRTGAKWSICWADNCPGQNKNNYIMWFFQDLIRRKIYSRIDYKFLVPGHTYGSTDQAFGVIERYAARIDTVYTPHDWYKHVRDAGIGLKAIQVVEMEQSYFKDYRQHLRNIFTERNKDEDKQNLDFQNIAWFNFGIGEREIGGNLVSVDHSTEVWVRHTYNVREKPRRVSYYKKKHSADLNTPPPPLYSAYPIPIKKAKADDLRKLVSEYVPMSSQSFYENIPVLEDQDSADSEAD